MRVLVFRFGDVAWWLATQFENLGSWLDRVYDRPSS